MTVHWLQYGQLGILRAHLFRVIKSHMVAEDNVQRFDALKALTDNGKDVTYFEDEMGMNGFGRLM